ncbi:MAG: protein-L-isoaspartate O-methyltransferase [Proteobacteria bacterium]|nr:protein-L-isoaspartate O-methyltransferase [Pseudomonadota bacterium]HQR03857.1 protein-L-isoaspartate O-methyltransferase [Rhodocyclaceae bacterium]
MNIEQARFNMVEQQIRTWEVLDRNVLDLLLAARREAYVPMAYRGLAFADTEIPIGHGAAMLSPKIEARALLALQVKKHEKVLEIGTGSGWMAALLAAHCGHVWSMEIEPALAEAARIRLRREGVMNVNVETGNGLGGLPVQAPFDAIMVSGGVSAVPQALLDQIKVGGRIFAFVGEAPVMEARLITRVDTTTFRARNVFETVVPALRGAVPASRFIF